MDNLNLTPYDFQVEDFKRLLKQHYCIAALEMGMGKSLVSLMVVSYTQLNTLIVVPAYLKTNWKNEILKVFKAPPTITVCKTKRDIPKEPTTQIVIVNYEMLMDCEHLFTWAGIVISDECHYLKNTKALRTKIFHDYMLKGKPERFIGLSGTPIDNNIPEFYSLIRLCSYNPKGTSGEKFTGSLWDFSRMFSNTSLLKLGSRTITQFHGVRNIGKLKKLLSGKYFRRLAKNHLNLKEMQFLDIQVDVSMTDEEYQEMWEVFESGKDKGSNAKLKSATMKAPITANYCNNLLEQKEGPLLIYSAHIAPVMKIADKLNGRTAVVTGMTPTDERQKIVDRFQNGELDSIVATVQSFSTGWNLVRSRNVIFNDESWSPKDNMQGRKRIDRIGQLRKPICHRIFGSRMDKHISLKLEEKERTTEAVL